MSVVVKKFLTLDLLFLLGLSTWARAQVKTGEANMSLNGTIDAGYSDDYSNLTGSGHSIGGGGAADLSGFYYNPNFLSFNIQPFYNQSRLNSTSQSMTAASGVNTNATIFGGSHFPGSISYSSVFNSTGNFGVPDLASYTTHGDTNNLGLAWGIHFPDYPTLNLSFTDGNSVSSVYGANSQGKTHAETFSATSSYHIAGFNLSGGYQHANLRDLPPEFLTGELSEPVDSDDNSLFFTVSHKLPWNGTVYGSVTRLGITTGSGDDNASGSKYTATVDTLTGGINFTPVPRLNLGEATYYTDNLQGTLYNTLLTAGAVAPESSVNTSSNDLSLTGFAGYDLPAEHLHLRADAERQQQSFLGVSFASNAYNETTSYSNKLLGGFFNGVLGVTWTSIDKTHESLLGLNSSINYTHSIRRWNVAGGFAYSQNVQTLLIAYTSSGYSYNGTVGRRLGRRSYWSAYTSDARSLLTAEPGSANSSRSYSTSLSLPRFSINGTYSASTGNALLTPTGLVANPVPLPAVNPAAVVFFNGKSYSVGLGSNPMRGLMFSAVFAKALTGTNSNSTVSNNNNENLYFVMVYNFRKLAFNAGYSRLVQGFSIAGTPPTMTGSFYVGISRWFNFF